MIKLMHLRKKNIITSISLNIRENLLLRHFKEIDIRGKKNMKSIKCFNHSGRINP